MAINNINDNSQITTEVRVKGLRLMKSLGLPEKVTNESRLRTPVRDNVTISDEAKKTREVRSLRENEVIDSMERLGYPKDVIESTRESLPNLSRDKLEVMNYFYGKMNEINRTYLKLPMTQKERYSAEIEKLYGSGSLYEFRQGYEALQKRWGTSS